MARRGLPSMAIGLVSVMMAMIAPAHAELGDIKALIIGIEYLNDQPPQQRVRGDRTAYLGLQSANADARRVLCALHPNIRARAKVFIEGQTIDPTRLTRRDCDKPRKPFQDALVRGADQKDLRTVIDDFVDSLDTDDTAFVYIAGHAFELNTKRWVLPPVPARHTVTSPATIAAPKPRILSLDEELVWPIRDIAQRLVLTLDACRTDFGDDALRDRVLTFFELTEELDRYTDDGELIISLASGLTPFDPTGYEDEGKTVTYFFSTAPGQTANDNGLFARHFARELKRRQPLSDVMRNTQAALMRDQDNYQEPFIQTNDGSDDVFMRGVSLSPSP